jgi:hypothetical protein
MSESEFETGEGSVSADTDPSSAFAEFIIGRRSAPTRWRRHLLPQGEKEESAESLNPRSAGSTASRFQLHAGTGCVSVLTLANGLKVNAIRNAPRPNAQEPI